MVKLAVENLLSKPQIVLCDYVGGLKSDYLELPLENIVDGDSKIFSIALASIIAKVSRDKMMADLDKKHPEYGFGKHKGYGTADHRSALVKYGVSNMHRKSYKPVKILMTNS